MGNWAQEWINKEFTKGATYLVEFGPNRVVEYKVTETDVFRQHGKVYLRFIGPYDSVMLNGKKRTPVKAGAEYMIDLNDKVKIKLKE